MSHASRKVKPRRCQPVHHQHHFPQPATADLLSTFAQQLVGYYEMQANFGAAVFIRAQYQLLYLVAPEKRPEESTAKDAKFCQQFDSSQMLIDALYFKRTSDGPLPMLRPDARLYLNVYARTALEYSQQADYEQALFWLDKITAHYHLDSAVNYVRGMVLVLQGEEDAAGEAFAKSAEHRRLFPHLPSVIVRDDWTDDRLVNLHVHFEAALIRRNIEFRKMGRL